MYQPSLVTAVGRILHRPSSTLGTRFGETMKPHWYKMIVVDCPVCGGGIIRKRTYGAKPIKVEDRYEYLPAIYCGRCAE